MIQGFIVGRLGKDAVVNQANGKSVINFTIAVDTGYGDKKETLWIDASKWGDKTTVAQYLTKGTQVAVTGELGIRTYVKNDGTGGASITLRVDKLDLVGGKSGGEQQAQTTTTAAEDDSSSLPF